MHTDSGRMHFLWVAATRWTNEMDGEAVGGGVRRNFRSHSNLLAHPLKVVVIRGNGFRVVIH